MIFVIYNLTMIKTYFRFYTNFPKKIARKNIVTNSENHEIVKVSKTFF